MSKKTMDNTASEAPLVPEGWEMVTVAVEHDNQFAPVGIKAIGSAYSVPSAYAAHLRSVGFAELGDGQTASLPLGTE